MEIKKINIVQKGGISSAKVYANVTDKKAKAMKMVLVGSLDKSLNEILLPFTDEVYDLTIDWGDKIPQITEMVLIRDASYLPSRTALQTRINDLSIDADLYTTTFYKDFMGIVEEATEVLAYNNSTQKDLDTVVSNIEKAEITQLVLR